VCKKQCVGQTTDKYSALDGIIINLAKEKRYPKKLISLFSTSYFFRARRPFSFDGITYYVSKTWQNGCRQRKIIASGKPALHMQAFFHSHFLGEKHNGLINE
jgi:hypothetical protein